MGGSNLAYYLIGNRKRQALSTRMSLLVILLVMPNSSLQPFIWPADNTPWPDLPFRDYEFPVKNQKYHPHALVFESRTLCKNHDLIFVRWRPLACFLEFSLPQAIKILYIPIVNLQWEIDDQNSDIPELAEKINGDFSCFMMFLFVCSGHSSESEMWNASALYKLFSQ